MPRRCCESPVPRPSSRAWVSPRCTRASSTATWPTMMSSAPCARSCRRWSAPTRSARPPDCQIQWFRDGCCATSSTTGKTTLAPRPPRSSGRSAVVAALGLHPVLDELHHRRVGQGRHVADLAVLRHVLEKPAHDLARPGLRQLGDDHHLTRLGDRTDLLLHVLAQLLDEGVGSLLAVLERGLLEDHERAH